LPPRREMENGIWKMEYGICKMKNGKFGFEMM
jgi:hypothetical protein